MRDEQVTKVMNELGGSDRDIRGWTYGPLRVERGGGIAGHGHEFWIRFPGYECDQYGMEPIGPCKTMKELRDALRSFLVKQIKFATAYLDLVRP